MRSLAGISLALSLALISGNASGQTQISVDEMIDIAASGVGCNYDWGGGCWDPANPPALGADCSGYVAKVWQIPERSEVTECMHPFTSSDFYYGPFTDMFPTSGRRC